MFLFCIGLYWIILYWISILLPFFVLIRLEIVYNFEVDIFVLGEGIKTRITAEPKYFTNFTRSKKIA